MFIKKRSFSSSFRWFLILVVLVSSSIVPVSTLSANSVLIRKHAVVILVEFDGFPIVNTDAYWANKIFGKTGKTANSYFDDATYGKIEFVPVRDTYGTRNDGVIKVKLTAEYIDKYGILLREKAISEAARFFHLLEYDINNDGIIQEHEAPAFIFIVAGFERTASAGRVAFDVISTRQHLNIPIHGTAALHARYTIQGEFSGHNAVNGKYPTPIGTLCHELGHILGLGDLYDTNYSSLGVGPYSLMSHSKGYLGNENPGETPVYLDPFSKIQLGLFEPETVEGRARKTLYSHTTGKYNVIRINTSNPTEYFLLENRQLEGYDASLVNFLTPSARGGIAIWHIDESRPHSVNDISNRYIRLIEANEGLLGYSQLDTKNHTETFGQNGFNHLFYKGHTDFISDNTYPSTRLYSGHNSGISIKVLSNPGREMVVEIDTDANSRDHVTDNLINMPYGSGDTRVFYNTSNAIKAVYTNYGEINFTFREQRFIQNIFVSREISQRSGRYGKWEKVNHRMVRNSGTPYYTFTLPIEGRYKVVIQSQSSDGSQYPNIQTFNLSYNKNNMTVFNRVVDNAWIDYRSIERTNGGKVKVSVRLHDISGYGISENGIRIGLHNVELMQASRGTAELDWSKDIVIRRTPNNASEFIIEGTVDTNFFNNNPGAYGLQIDTLNSNVWIKYGTVIPEFVIK